MPRRKPLSDFRAKYASSAQAGTREGGVQYTPRAGEDPTDCCIFAAETMEREATCGDAGVDAWGYAAVILGVSLQLSASPPRFAFRPPRFAFRPPRFGFRPQRFACRPQR